MIGHGLLAARPAAERSRVRERWTSGAASSARISYARIGRRPDDIGRAAANDSMHDDH
jgi:hypothetical protein